MNRLFKGAIASAAGVALLLGGAGTFALWNDTLPFTGIDRTITAGHLEFLGDAMPGAQWAINGRAIAAEDVSALRIVPGDELTMTWNDIEVSVEGDFLVAKFGVDLDDFAAGLENDAEALAFYNLLNPTIEVTEIPDVGAPIPHPANDEIELAEGVHTFGVVARVFFSQDAANEVRSQISLGGLGLTVEQVPHTLHPAYPVPTQEPTQEPTPEP